MKVAFLRFWTRVFLQGRLYYLWSKLYQATFERWARSVRLPAYGSIEELENTLSRMQWERDGVWELGDAIGGPKATYAKYIAGAKIAKDCDEFALYAADRLRDMSKRGVLFVDSWVKANEIGLLSVPWMDGEGSAGGHNVCAFRYEKDDKVRWAHMSNWFRGKVQWNFESLEDVVRAVLVGKTSLGWAWASPDLKLKRFGSGKSLG